MDLAGWSGHFATVQPSTTKPQLTQPGRYPWDDWQRGPLAVGVAVELATLGRAVMREAHQHSWYEDLRDECGAGREEAANGLIFETLEKLERSSY